MAPIKVTPPNRNFNVALSKKRYIFARRGVMDEDKTFTVWLVAFWSIVAALAIVVFLLLAPVEAFAQDRFPTSRFAPPSVGQCVTVPLRDFATKSPPHQRVTEAITAGGNVVSMWVNTDGTWYLTARAPKGQDCILMYGRDFHNWILLPGADS
jgi:hypothetical protein